MKIRKLIPVLGFLTLVFAALACNLPFKTSPTTFNIVATLTPPPTSEFIFDESSPGPTFFVEEFDNGISEDWTFTLGWSVLNNILSTENADAILEIPGDWQDFSLFSRLKFSSEEISLHLNRSEAGFYSLILTRESISLVWQPVEGDQELLSSLQTAIDTGWHDLVLRQTNGKLEVLLDGEPTLKQFDLGLSPAGSIALSKTGSGKWEIDRIVMAPPGMGPGAPTPTPDLTNLSPQSAAGPTIEDLMVACPSPEEIASVDQDLKLDFVDDITTGTYVCSAADGSVDLTLIEKNLYHAILAMRWIEFDEPLPWTELSLYDWFVQAVNGVIVDSREEFSHCCTNEGMIILGLGDNSFTAHTDRFLRDEVGQGGFDGINGVDTLVQLLAHEARHNDGEGYPHTCENSNDKTIAEMGSFAIDYYLYRWFADHTDPEFMRSQVRLNDWYDLTYTGEADWMLNHRFCDEPSYTPSP